MTNSSLSTLTDEALFELLTVSASGSTEDVKKKRIVGLEELRKRVESKSIKDFSRSIDVLLEMTKKQGLSQPESSLIVDSLLLVVTENSDAFRRVLIGLEGQEQEESSLFIVFSRLVIKLERSMKEQAIAPLVRFLMRRNNLNDVGVKEIYECLVYLGNEKLSARIVIEVESFLGSLEVCAVIFSVKLSAQFAGIELLPRMHEVLEKSVRGYFDGHYTDIESDICRYFARVKDQRSIPDLLKLVKMRSKNDCTQIGKAIAAVLDENPFRIDDVLDSLYDERYDKGFIDAILQSFQQLQKTKVNARKLLAKIHMNWWNQYPTTIYMHQLLVKNGKQSKSALLEILQQNEKYDFALECLREIGVTNEELSTIFAHPLMLQIYEYFSKAKFPRGLNQIWEEKQRLCEAVKADTDRLEHLILHIFSAFNFVSMNLVPLKIRSIDIVCFYPETLDLLVIGCTTGILKNDLANMDAIVRRMENDVADVFDKCTITPIVVSTEIAAIPSSDKQYASQTNIIVLQRQDIDRLLEMLYTNRSGKEAIHYIKSRVFPQEVPHPY
jgi:hypothetical protein